MDNIKQIVASLFLLIKTSKLKFFVFLISFIVFTFLLFPFSDLSDLVSAQISKATNNTVYLSFQDLKIGFFPTGLKMEKVVLEGASLPSLQMDELVLTPSLFSLFKNKPYGSLNLGGIWKGDLKLSLNSGNKSEAGTEREKVDVSVQKVSLASIKESFEVSVSIRGSLNLQGLAQFDPTFKEQPEADLELILNQFELLSSSIPTQMGSLMLPELKISQIDLKARLAGGSLFIEKTQIGKEGDELHGTIKGSMGLQLDYVNGAPIPRFSNYRLDLDLKVKPSLQNRAQVFLELLSNHKTSSIEGYTYKFRVTAQNFGYPPQFETLR